MRLRECSRELPPEFKAFMLLKVSEVMGVNKRLLVSRLDFKKSDTLYDQLKIQLWKKAGERQHRAIPEKDRIGWSQDEVLQM